MASKGQGKPGAAEGGRGRSERSAAPVRLLPEIEHEIAEIVEASGCELVHAEFGGGVLRLFIDRPERPGGVDLGDCETVSKQVSALLDVVDFGSGRYTLEVSSPGLDRRLYDLRDYRRFAGSLARVTFREPESGKKRTVVGRLGELREPDGPGGPEVAIDLVERNETLVLPLEAVEVARLEIEL